MKELFNILTSQFGLPIPPLWEWLVFLTVGEIIHVIAWNASPGGKIGSLFYWVTKFLAFLFAWALLNSIIITISFIVKNWIWFTIGALVLAVLLIGCAIIIRIMINEKDER